MSECVSDCVVSEWVREVSTHWIDYAARKVKDLCLLIINTFIEAFEILSMFFNHVTLIFDRIICINSIVIPYFTSVVEQGRKGKENYQCSLYQKCHYKFK